MRSRLLPVALIAGLALAGCGSTTIRHVTTTVTRTSSSAGPTTSTSTSTSASASSSTTTARSSSSSSASTGNSGGPGRSALARRSPRTVLALAAAALRRAGGYAMRADLVQDRTRTIIDLSANGTRRYSASLTTGPAAFSLVALPGSAYLRGNRAFWKHQGGGARAGALAGHWLRVPNPRTVTRSLGTLTPGTLARCLVEDHGTLSISGHTVVDGRRAVVVRDAGNAPGSTPSTIAVAASGPPYPLRYDATGVTRRGGRVDVCNDGKGDGATGTIALSQFGATPSVQAPATSGSAPGTGSAT